MGITREKVGMKQNNMITGKKITTILVILFAFFIFARLFLMPNLGQWLVAEDDLQASDMIVVLMGSLPDRILQAVDIYNERYSEKLVFVNSYREMLFQDAFFCCPYENILYYLASLLLN